jgi:hypothetical protein
MTTISGLHIIITLVTRAHDYYKWAAYNNNVGNKGQRYYYIQTTSEKLYFLLLMLLFNSKHFEKSIDFVSHDIVWRTPIPEPRLLVTEVNICGLYIIITLVTRAHDYYKWAEYNNNVGNKGT